MAYFYCWKFSHQTRLYLKALGFYVKKKKKPIFAPEEGCVFASELTCLLLFAVHYFLT